jgi:hypothetical protein
VVTDLLGARTRVQSPRKQPHRADFNPRDIVAAARAFMVLVCPLRVPAHCRRYVASPDRACGVGGMVLAWTGTADHSASAMDTTPVVHPRADGRESHDAVGFRFDPKDGCGIGIRRNLRLRLPAAAGFCAACTNTLVTYLGSASLSIYLMHTMFSAGAREFLEVVLPVGGLTMLAITVVAGFVGPLIVHEIAGRFGGAPYLGLGRLATTSSVQPSDRPGPH